MNCYSWEHTLVLGLITVCLLLPFPWEIGKKYKNSSSYCQNSGRSLKMCILHMWVRFIFTEAVYILRSSEFFQLISLVPIYLAPTVKIRILDVCAPKTRFSCWIFCKQDWGYVCSYYESLQFQAYSFYCLATIFYIHSILLQIKDAILLPTQS